MPSGLDVGGEVSKEEEDAIRVAISKQQRDPHLYFVLNPTQRSR
jgi:hypothetical protein